jgi:hypothetical protein
LISRNASKKIDEVLKYNYRLVFFVFFKLWQRCIPYGDYHLSVSLLLPLSRKAPAFDLGTGTAKSASGEMENGEVTKNEKNDFAKISVILLILDIYHSKILTNKLYLNSITP